MPLLPNGKAFAAALSAVAARGFAALPLLDDLACSRLLASCGGLSYRLARPLAGAAGREVRQDFDLTMTIPRPHPIRDLAAALDCLALDAARRLDPDPLPGGIVFNDLIVQRYRKGSLGIAPHRDHLRYSGLVVLVPLAGAARFFTCADRSGAGAEEIPAPPGTAILLSAPGFAGRGSRPFHFLDRVTQPRVSLGIRQDTRPGEPV